MNDAVLKKCFIFYLPKARAPMTVFIETPLLKNDVHHASNPAGKMLHGDITESNRNT